MRLSRIRQRHRARARGGQRENPAAQLSGSSRRRIPSNDPRYVQRGERDGRKENAQLTILEADLSPVTCGLDWPAHAHS